MEQKNSLKSFSGLLSTNFALLHAEALTVITKLVNDDQYREEVVQYGLVKDLLKTLPTTEEQEQLSILAVLQVLHNNGK